MSGLSVLVCVLPARGHVSPTLAVVQALVERGDAVHVVTGRRYAERFAGAGAGVTLLEPDADFDDTDFDASYPGRAGLSGIALARHDLAEVFIRPMPSRWATTRAVLDATGPDVVLVDPFFLAGIPLLLTRTARSPRVLVLGFLPLMLPPYAPPGPWSALREPATAFGMHRMLAPVDDLAHRLVRDLTGRELPVWFTEWVGLSDGILQMTCPGFEYPRPGPPTPIHFVGTPASSTAAVHAPPDWWGDLEAARSVVHVTQGTVANADLGEVVLPTIEALSGTGHLVVVSTGGAPTPAGLPDDVRVADFLPYDDLLPRCSVMVTNGGYGGVNLALRHGVPLVLVGATQDKRAIAERVTWSGVGLGIGRRTVPPARIARAVRQVEARTTYRHAARRLGAQLAAIDTAETVHDIVHAVVARA